MKSVIKFSPRKGDVDTNREAERADCRQRRRTKEVSEARREDWKGEAGAEGWNSIVAYRTSTHQIRAPRDSRREHQANKNPQGERTHQLHRPKVDFCLVSRWRLQDSDAAIERLKKQLDNLISEKELITTQITRKCEEIELLNQKINMMQMALDRSECAGWDQGCLEDFSLREVNEVQTFQDFVLVETFLNKHLTACRQQPIQRPTRRHKVAENRNKKSKIAAEPAGSRLRQHGRYATRSAAVEPGARSRASTRESLGEWDDDTDECSQVAKTFQSKSFLCWSNKLCSQMAKAQRHRSRQSGTALKSSNLTKVRWLIIL